MGTIECSQPASKSSWDSQDFVDINMVLKMAHFRKSTGPRWVKALLCLFFRGHCILSCLVKWLSTLLDFRDLIEFLIEVPCLHYTSEYLLEKTEVASGVIGKSFPCGATWFPLLLSDSKYYLDHDNVYPIYMHKLCCALSCCVIIIEMYMISVVIPLCQGSKHEWYHGSIHMCQITATQKI